MIYIENGTNFRGAEIDVVNAFKTWDQESVRRELLQRNIQWHFSVALLVRQNPCSAPCDSKDSHKFQARWKHLHILSNELWVR